MSDTKVRKTVVTLADVNTAFTGYAAIRTSIGMPVTGHSFDRGNRGRGFAQYDENDNVVRTFETKEDAFTFYNRYVEVAQEILHAPAVSLAESDQNGTDSPEGTSDKGESESDDQADAQPSVPKQTRRRVKSNA